MARRDLVLACSAIGALGGALFGAMFSAPGYRTPWHGWEPIVAVALPSAVCACWLGSALTKRGLGRKALPVARDAIAFTFVAGLVNGWLVLALSALVKQVPNLDRDFAMVVVGAAIFGLIAAIPFVPAIAAVTFSASRVHARVGSFAEASQRRRIASTAAVSLAIAALLVPTRHHTLAATIALLALVATTTLSIVEALSLRRLRVLSRGGDWERLAEVAAPTVDLGLGDELWIRRELDETYRTGVAGLVRRGDALLTETVARDSLRGHAVAAAVSLAAAVVKLV